MMNHEPVLAAVARRLGRGTEDLATEAMVHIAKRPAARDRLLAILRELRPDLEEITRYESQVLDPEDSVIPDIAGSADGGTRVLIEVKLSAGLTDNQPAAYVDRLRTTGAPTLLAFLVPERRRAVVWQELQRRCASRGDSLTAAEHGIAADIGPVRLGIVTWEKLLEEWDAAAGESADDEMQSDVTQLRGLYESQERVARTPLRSDFLTSSSTGSQLRTVTHVMSLVVGQLRAEGVVDKGGRWSGDPSWMGTHLSVGDWKLLLYVSLRRWGTEGPTPVWLRVFDRPAAASALRSLLSPDGPMVIDDAGMLVFPITLEPGVEVESLQMTMDRQVRRVCEYLRAHSVAADSSDGDPDVEGVEER